MQQHESDIGREIFDSDRALTKVVVNRDRRIFVCDLKGSHEFEQLLRIVIRHNHETDLIACRHADCRDLGDCTSNQVVSASAADNLFAFARLD